MLGKVTVDTRTRTHARTHTHAHTHTRTRTHPRTHTVELSFGEGVGCSLITATVHRAYRKRVVFLASSDHELMTIA